MLIGSSEFDHTAKQQVRCSQTQPSGFTAILSFLRETETMRKPYKERLQKDHLDAFAAKRFGGETSSAATLAN